MKFVGNIFKWLGIGVYAVCALLIVMFLMPVGGWKALNVLTGSMKPTIQPGTLVLIHRVALRDIKQGDIVTYQNPRNFKQTITHRVVRVAKSSGTTMVTVKGDANPTADAPFPGGLIVGRVAAIVPGAGQFISWLHNPVGLAALVIIPGIFVIWAEIRRLQRALVRPTQAAKEEQFIPVPAKTAVVEPAPQVVPVSIAVAPKEQPAHTKRSLDGMRKLSMLLLVPAMLLLAVHGTYALGSVGQVRLANNSFTAVKTLPLFPMSADDCKEGGWKKFTNPDGSRRFKNQGRCVSFVETHKQDHDHDHDHDHDGDGNHDQGHSHDSHNQSSQGDHDKGDETNRDAHRDDNRGSHNDYDSQGDSDRRA